MEDKIFIECSCHGHILQVEKDKEIDELCISFWSCGHSGQQFDWKHRIRLIWHIIKYGYPWSDMVLLNKKEEDKLIKFLVGEE
jgi:hypothetical protein